MLISDKQEEANRQNASTPPVRRLGRVRKPCASTPSPTACVPVTSSSPAKTPRNTSNSGPISKPSGNPRTAPNGCIWNRWPPPNGCWRGLPKARGASMCAKVPSRNSWPSWTAFPCNARAWSVPSRVLRELKQLQLERQAQRQQQQPAPTVQAAQPPVHRPAEPKVTHPAYLRPDRKSLVG